MAQLRVLLIVGHDPRMTSGQLAKRLVVRPSTVTGIVDRLERQDLIRRDQDADDRRIVRAFLTRRGVGVTTEAVRVLRPFLGRILGGMGEDDLGTLSRLMEQAEELGLLPRPVACCAAAG